MYTDINTGKGPEYYFLLSDWSRRLVEDLVESEIDEGCFFYIHPIQTKRFSLRSSMYCSLLYLEFSK